MHELVENLRRILTPKVEIAIGSPDDPLWPGEELRNAVPIRLAEFAGGRSAARRAIRALGLPVCAIPIGHDRAPIWPSHVVGSISHCTGACLAVAGRSLYFQGLGLDIERANPLPQEIWEAVLRPEEIHAIENSSAIDPLAALQIFVAKEAAYKAQYPISRQLFDFQTLSVSVTDNHFTATFQQDIHGFPAGSAISGSFACSSGFQVAACWILK